MCSKCLSLRTLWEFLSYIILILLHFAVSKDKLCDGKPDCADGADERDACCKAANLL